MQHLRIKANIWRWLAYLLCVCMFVLSGCSPISVAKTAVVSKVTTIVPAPTPAPKSFPNAAQIDAYLTRLADSGALTGSVLVARNGMLFSKGYGPADKEANIANTAHTMFRIGSITKQFTAMAILILQERGKLHVQDHLCLYVPDCPQAWQPLTLEHLLTHTSGIPDYTNFPDFVATWAQPTTPEQLVARFKDKLLEFTPGSKWSYSNSGYILLGYIIERVSGKSYASFLRENIFVPLEMNNTGYDDSHPHLPEHATGYYAGYVKPEFYDMSVVYAAGALYSNVEDLYVWQQALRTHKFVSQQSLDAMFTPHIPCPPGGCALHTDLGYGYGWFIAAEPPGKLIYHLGHIDGYFTYSGFYPASNIDVAVLSNLEGTDALKIGTTLAAMVSGAG